MPYPRELRQRVVDQSAEGNTQAEIAESLCVSVGWVNKVLQCFAVHGQLFLPRTKKPGRVSKLGEKQYALLRKWLTERPELTLGQLAEKMEENLGVPVNHTNIHDALRVMGYTHKKNGRSGRATAGGRKAAAP